jgi:hypothetical protein
MRELRIVNSTMGHSKNKNYILRVNIFILKNKNLTK